MNGRTEYGWERNRQYVPNKRVSMLRLLRWRKMRRTNRRRKSLIAYWWAPFLICSIVGAGLFGAYWGLPKSGPKNVRYPLNPTLRVVYTTQEVLNTLVKEENVRRLSMALNDDDIGISLHGTLPEPPQRAYLALPLPNFYAVETAAERTSPATLLPPMAPVKQVVTAPEVVVCTRDEALTACDFQATFPEVPADVAELSAKFFVRLNESGRVIEVLRLAPGGKESAWMRQLRTALLDGRGTGAAQGMLRIHREPKVSQ